MTIQAGLVTINIISLEMTAVHGRKEVIDDHTRDYVVWDLNIYVYVLVDPKSLLTKLLSLY